MSLRASAFFASMSSLARLPGGLFYGCNMGDLSKRFSRKEFACGCGCGFETVDHELIENLEQLGDEFEMREDCERVAISINSGNRCAAHDRSIKIKIAEDQGVPYKPKDKPSEHLRGWACDFRMEYVYPDGRREKISDDEIADYLEMEHVARHGIGRYQGRTHYDVRTNGPARWDNR